MSEIPAIITERAAHSTKGPVVTSHGSILWRTLVYAVPCYREAKHISLIGIMKKKEYVVLINKGLAVDKQLKTSEKSRRFGVNSTV